MYNLLRYFDFYLLLPLSLSSSRFIFIHFIWANMDVQTKMFLDGTNGIRPIGDGLLEVTEASLKNLIVQGDINEIYDVEQTPFARYF